MVAADGPEHGPTGAFQDHAPPLVRSKSKGFIEADSCTPTKTRVSDRPLSTSPSSKLRTNEPNTRDAGEIVDGPMRGMVASSSSAAQLAGLIDGKLRAAAGPDGQVSLFESEVMPEAMVNTADGEWQDVEFEVALDGGCTDNVCHPGDVPGYIVEASMGSRCGQGFLVGNGERVPNAGQAHLSLQTDGEVQNGITSTFQVAKVSRPLMSVGRLCDVGMQVVFDKNKARVVAPDGAEVCAFERQSGGLYLCKFRLKRPPNPSQPFGRRG